MKASESQSEPQVSACAHPLPSAEVGAVGGEWDKRSHVAVSDSSATPGGGSGRVKGHGTRLNILEGLARNDFCNKPKKGRVHWPIGAVARHQRYDQRRWRQSTAKNPGRSLCRRGRSP